MSHSQLAYRIAFSSVRGITRTLADKILAVIGSEEAFFTASAAQLAAALGFRSRILDDSYRQSLLDTAEAELHRIDNQPITPIYFTDEAYPARLADCEDAPLMLYASGSCPLNSDAPTVAIVGTRHATAYGVGFTRDFVAALAEKCLTPPIIVSGLAYGIDIAAHRAALEAGIPTIAVLAHGLNTVYPSAHRQTAAQIIRSNGLLLTDYKTGDPLHKGNFIARNRIVAQLSDALVVMESAEKGGAMITARLAGEYGRDVFALPGRLTDPYSAGTNALIARNRASLLTSAEDFAAAMNWPMRTAEPQQQTLFPEVSPEQQAILEFLTANGQSQVNPMSVQLNIPVGKLMALLIDLEFKHLVAALPGAKYQLA